MRQLMAVKAMKVSRLQELVTGISAARRSCLLPRPVGWVMESTA